MAIHNCKAGVYFGPCQTPMMEIFVQIVNGFPVVTNFTKKASFLMFGRVLNTPLQCNGGNICYQYISHFEYPLKVPTDI